MFRRVTYLGAALLLVLALVFAIGQTSDADKNTASGDIADPGAVSGSDTRQTGDISLDEVEGLLQPGQLMAGVGIKFTMRLSNYTGNKIIGFENGFRVFSPDGATWSPLIADTISHGWPDRFDMLFSIVYSSVNGSGADTVGFSGMTFFETGLPNGFDEQVWSIETQVYEYDNGKILCLDSCWLPPSGAWGWALDSKVIFYPGWDGPHCFEIAGVPNSPPEITNCPPEVIGGWCETIYYDFDADDPEADDYWFEHLSGPGTINPSTGEWTFQPGPYDIGWHPLELRACDQYDCGPSCYTGIIIINEPPFFISGCDTIITAHSGQTVDHYVQAIDPDPCDILEYSGDVHPFPTGPFSIDPMTGHFHFEPDAVDLDTFQVEIWAEDIASEMAFCEFKVVILPYHAPTPGWSKHNTSGYKPGRGSPLGSTWHELWPDYCHDWELTGWIDNDDGTLSYCDTVEFTDAGGRKSWEHVKKVLPTLTVTIFEGPTIYLDGLDANPNIDDIHDPVGTFWHEVYPNYGRVWEIIWWEESEPNGVLDFCDYIGIEEVGVGGEVVQMEVHVEAFETDIVTTPIPPAVGKTSDNTDGFKPSMGNPIGTYWHELYRNFCRGWEFTGWHDEGDGILSEGDIIHVTDQESGQTTYERVDWVGNTLLLTDYLIPQCDTMYLEAITPQPDTSSEVTQPAGSMWQEVHPTNGVTHQIFSWNDTDDNGILDFCDYASVQILSGPDSGCFWHAHVEGVRTDIRTSPATPRGRIRDHPEYPPPVDPIGTPWHELWPNFCTDWEPTGWEDNGDGILSFCDAIEFTNTQTGRSIWEHIEWVGPTLGLTDDYVPNSDTAYFEPVNPKPGDMDNPEGTIWHEVHPNYCILVRIHSFTDHGNPGLDPGDFMMVHFISGPDSCSLFHGRVATVGTDMTTLPLPPPTGDGGNRWDRNDPDEPYNPGDPDPIGSGWTEMYEDYGANWEIDQWYDEGNEYLGFNDTIRMQNLDIPDSSIWAHVEKITSGFAGLRYGFDTVQFVELWNEDDDDEFPPDPPPPLPDLKGIWIEVHPDYATRWFCEYWNDRNSSGYIDATDSVLMSPIDGPDSGLVTRFAVANNHVILFKDSVPPDSAPQPRYCDYYKQQYIDYAPQSGPDFDMKQVGWVCPDNVNYPSIWNHDGPASVANCLWWFDSKFEPSPVNPNPFYPPFNHDDDYPLVESYNPSFWDDHDTNNVQPFITELGILMNTCNWIYHGTHIDSLVSGTRQYILSKGLSHAYVDTLVEGPTHQYITEQIHQSQDVVLLLGFYEYVNDEQFLIGGHYVMVPGYCTYNRRLCISDPWFDALEGEPPAGQAHDSTLHNDANNISGPHSQVQHDPYFTSPISLVKYPRPSEMMVAYPVDSLDMVQFQNLNLFGDRIYSGGPITTTIEYAYVICPDTMPARWDFHFRGYDACPGGTLSVWGTINCNTVGDPIYEQYVKTCSTYAGPVPSWANDVIMRFAWDYSCHNVNNLKIAAPTYVGGVWRLLRLNPWINAHVRSDIDLPTIGDPTGVVQHVYYVVDLQQWLADPRPMLEEYAIVDGECPDLPGYLIGTTPIVFDSLAPPTRGTPFSTTPFTGTLYRDGEAYMSKGGLSCCIPPIRGDVDYSTGIIDIADLVYLVDFMFNQGPAPPCFEEGDVDGSDAAPIDIADLVYLVDYMFNQGPAPALCP